MSSAFVICRRSPVLARRSALVWPDKLHAARYAPGKASPAASRPLCAGAGISLDQRLARMRMQLSKDLSGRCWRAAAVWPLPAGVLDAPGLDQPGVDGRLLFGFADTGQVGEEVGSVGDGPGVEPGTKLTQNLLARMQALRGRPGTAVGVPRLAGVAPFLVPPVEPARISAGRGKPV